MQNTPHFPASKQIQVNGIELEVFEAGHPHQNPIVLCHGWPEHAYSWRHQVHALVEAGHHVIIPNQRGYGRSSRPADVSAYGVDVLCADLVGLLDHFGYDDATFVGHDWGSMVVWALALLHPTRVHQVVNFALPYQERGDKPWITMMEEAFGGDHYFVHFNRQPGVADAVLNENPHQFLRNLFRKNVPLAAPEPGMMMINLARASQPLGEAIMSEEELSVFVSAFESAGFTGSINWYRNLDHNWHVLADVDPIVRHRALMVYGERDLIPKSPSLTSFVPNVDVVSLDCGHWIQQEKPEETNRILLDWLKDERSSAQ